MATGFPVIDYAIAWSAGPRDNPDTVTAWTSVLRRSQGSVSTQRGRQAELDSVQPGTLSIELDNRDGALDPSNGSSPFAGSVVPYRLFRMRAQYPATVNLLTVDQANATTTVTPPTSTGSFNVALASWAGWSMPQAPVSVSFSVTLSATQSSTFPNLGIEWHDRTGAVISTTYGVAKGATVAAQRFTVTAVAPAGAVSAVAVLVCDHNTRTTATTWTVTQPQLEYAAASTSFVVPGTWYPIFVGYVERFPQTWTDSGMRGAVSPTVVDVLGWLSGQHLWPAYVADLLSMSPSFLFPLWEDSLTTGAIDVTGQRPAVLPDSGAYGPSAGGVVGGSGDSVVPGSDFTSGTADNAPGQFLGSPLSAATFANTLIPLGTFGAASFLDLGDSARAAGLTPGPPASGAWSRLFAFKLAGDGIYTDGTHTNFTTETLWEWRNPSYVGTGRSSVMALSITGGSLYFTIDQHNAHLALQHTAAMVNDGKWHHVAVWMEADRQTVYLSVDYGRYGRYSTTLPYPYTDDLTPNGSDILGASMDPATGKTSQPFTGQIGLVAELPGVSLTAATINDQPGSSHTALPTLYQSWRNGYGALGDPRSVTNPYGGADTSGKRYSRIAQWAGFGGTVSADTGETQEYGPAVELNSTDRGSNPDVTSALQSVVDTEGGTHYAGANGWLYFRTRQRRMLTATPAVTFGENVGAGEVPYLGDIEFAFDPDHLVNDGAVTQEFQQGTFVATDPVSIARFGDRTTSRTVNTNDALEAQAAAQWITLTEAQPHLRVSTITVDASTNPTAWAKVLSVGPGTRVRVMRRPPAPAPAVAFDGWVESVGWTIDGPSGSAQVKFDVSPVFTVTPAMAVGDVYTIRDAVALGAMTAVVLPLPDATVNSPISNIPYGDSGNFAINNAAGLIIAVVQIDKVQDVGTTGTAFTVTFRNPTTAAIPAGSFINDPTVNYSAYLPGSVLDSIVAGY